MAILGEWSANLPLAGWGRLAHHPPASAANAIELKFFQCGFTGKKKLICSVRALCRPREAHGEFVAGTDLERSSKNVRLYLAGFYPMKGEG